MGGGHRLRRHDQRATERGRHLEGDARRVVAAEAAVAQAEDELRHLRRREAGQHVGRRGADARHDARVLGREQRPPARGDAIEGGEHDRLDRRLPLFDLDVERHAGEGLEQRGEGGDAEAAVAIRVGAVGGAEAVAGVEAFHRREREGARRTRAVGRALERLVVQHHDDRIGGRVHVQLEPLGAGLQPRRKGVERVLGDESGGAAVGEEPRARTVEVARRPTPSGTPAWRARR